MRVGQRWARCGAGWLCSRADGGAGGRAIALGETRRRWEMNGCTQGWMVESVDERRCPRWMAGVRHRQLHSRTGGGVSGRAITLDETWWGRETSRCAQGWMVWPVDERSRSTRHEWLHSRSDGGWGRLRLIEKSTVGVRAERSRSNGHGWS